MPSIFANCDTVMLYGGSNRFKTACLRSSENRGTALLNPPNLVKSRWCQLSCQSGDLIEVKGDLTLDGTLRILTPNALSLGVYTLITYTGDLIDNVLNLATSVPGLALSLTAEAGSVLLHVTEAPPPEPVLISGDTTNNGTLFDPVVGQDGSLEGGTLAGSISNEGEIRNVVLSGGARVSGGIISGNISGTASRPAELNNTTIKSGTRLENVIISGNTVLRPGVILGPNVRFDSDTHIPGGLDLSGALHRISGLEEGLLNPLNLEDDIVGPGAGFMSIIRSMQLLGGFEPSGTSLEQNPTNGELLVVAEDFRSVVLPARVSMANPDDEEGVSVNADGDIVIVSVNRRVILNYPALQEAEVFSNFLSDLGLRFDRDERANLIITTTQENSPPELRNGRYMSAATGRFTQYYSGRPDAIAVPAPQGLDAGVHVREFVGLKNAIIYSLVFADANGKLLEQDVAPVPADWLLLKESLISDYGFADARIGLDGVITVKLADQVIRARSVYDVTRDVEHVTESSRLIFEPIGDVNGDGTDDVEMRFPNGDRQQLLILP